MKRIIGPAIGLVATLCAGSALAACGGTGKVVFTDSFVSLGKEWGSEDKFMSVKGGEMIIAEQQKAYSIWATPEYRNVDYCATVRLTESSDLGSSYGGLMFWARDNDHYFTFQITLDGYGTVYEFDDGDWKSLIDDRAFPAIKQGIGAVNELRVVTRGSNATFYVNGQKFDTVTVKTAPGTQHIGFAIEAPSGDGGKATFAFDNLEVRAP